MKKLVITANIIFWTAFLILMATLFNRGMLFKFLAPDNVAFIVWAAGFLMFVGFQMLFTASVPATKIKKGRAYKLTAVIPHIKGKTLILSYDDRVENFWCGDILAPETPKIGKKYTIAKIGDDILLTPF
jgi:hypothetical protein